MVVAPDGRTAAAVSSNGWLVLIDVAAERVVAEVKAHRLGASFRVAFDPATATVVTVGSDGYLRTWSADDGTPRREHHISASEIYGLDVHAGRAVTAAKDGGVALIDLTTGLLVRQYHGHTSPVLTARFRGDGQWFVTGEERRPRLPVADRRGRVPHLARRSHQGRGHRDVRRGRHDLHRLQGRHRPVLAPDATTRRSRRCSRSWRGTDRGADLGAGAATIPRACRAGGTRCGTRFRRSSRRS